MKELIWEGSARQEFIEAAVYYAEVDLDLGERFVSEVEVAVAKPHAAPLLYRKFDGMARKVRVTRFPYAVVYWLEKQTIHIVAVMHLHREPGYWRKRLLP